MKYIILAVLALGPIAVSADPYYPTEDSFTSDPYGDSWGTRTTGIQFSDGSSATIWNY